MNRFKIVAKFLGRGNVLDIGIAFPDGTVKRIGRICMPDDGQLADNVKCGDEVCGALQRRFRKSV